MFTILIPVLKQGFLKSQLYWLSQQIYKDFNVVVMNAFYKQDRYQPWIKKKYPFNLIHIPLIHNINMSKRFDFSIKNNLALLSPTKDFLFFSDSHYITTSFTKKVSEYVMQDKHVAFDVYTVLYPSYDPIRHTVDLNGQTDHRSRPVILFNKKMFFHILNGYDEAMTYCFDGEFMTERVVNTGYDVYPENGFVFHLLHNPNDRDFGPLWRKPCEKCSDLFSKWKFDFTMESGEFPIHGDPELVDQMTYMDRDLGIPMFQCPNCGFGGCQNFAVYHDVIVNQRLTEAPKSALDGRTGRDLSKIYETMSSKVENTISAKMSYIKTTY